MTCRAQALIAMAGAIFDNDCDKERDEILEIRCAEAHGVNFAKNTTLAFVEYIGLETPLSPKRLI